MSKYTLNNLQDLCKVMIKDIKNQKTYLNKLENENIYLQNEKQQLKEKVNQLETNRDEAIEYLTSYEAIHTIQFGVEKPMKKDTKNNKSLDEKTIIEMTRRHLIVHDKTLSLLERGKE